MTYTQNDREQAAMEAAGATDEDLTTTIAGLQSIQHLDDLSVLLLRACVDERENRAQARFLDRRAG